MVSSLTELMQVQADVAVTTLRADHSSWNKQHGVVPRHQVSKVTWDSTILYNPGRVIEPLQEMFDHAEQQHDIKTLIRFREALRTVLHENVHLMAGAGTSLAFPLDAYEGKAHKVFEEGVTERATRNELSNYIDALDLDRVAPGIRAAPTQGAYEAYVPAVDEFSEAVGEDVGLEPAEVVRRMAVLNAAQKFPVAAELLYEKHLSKLLPETARADAINRIAEAMHGPFAAIHDYDPKEPSDVRMSAMAGRNAYDKASEKIQELAGHWSNNQELRRTLDASLSATAPLHKPPRDGRGGEGPRGEGSRSETSRGETSRGETSHGEGSRGDGAEAGQRPSWNGTGGHRPSSFGPTRLPHD